MKEGILVHGIPEFRLEKSIVEKSIKNILELGIKVKYKKELGKNLDLEELTQKIWLQRNIIQNIM